MSGLYRYCGLILDSQRPLPELESVAGDPTSDILVRDFRAGRIPGDLERYGPNWAIGPSEAWWWLKDKVCFRVRPGSIDIDGNDTEHSLVRALLLEAPMIMAMIFRDIFCLNAASVALDDDTLVFCGAAGSGRSTAAVRIALQGGKMISDSLARIDVSEKTGAVIVPQGSGSLLWPHSLMLLGATSDLCKPVRNETSLCRVQLEAVTLPRRVERIYWRNPHPASHQFDDKTTASRPARYQFSRIACITAGRLWIDPAGRSTAHFQWCLDLARSCQLLPAPKLYFA